MSQRIGGGFRNEKNAISSYNQSFFSFDSKIFSSILAENDCLAIGFTALNERSPGEGIKNDYFSISLAFNKGLNTEGDQQIGVGFQTTLGRKRIDLPTYFFEDQLNAWIQSGFANLDIFQLNPIDISYIDLNVGVIYQGKINFKNFFSVSSTLHHANKPNKSFQGGELILKRQFGGHISWERRPTEKKTIYTFLLVNLPENNETFIGGVLIQSTITTKKYQVIYGGSFKKNFFRGQSITPIFGLKFKELNLNLSYDINVFNSNSQQNGASEISLTFTNAFSRSRYLENKFIRY